MKKYFYITILILFLCLCFYIYKLTTYTYITAKFKELRPIHEKLTVYYKGLVVGHARELKHSDSFEHTLIKIALYPKNMLLPENTTVLLKKEKRNEKERDFLELIYPKEPSKVLIANGSVLEGIATVDVETYFKNQNPDDLENIKQNLALSVEQLSYAMDGLNQMFTIINEILEQNKPNLYKTTTNFKNVTQKFDNSLDGAKLSNTVSNIDSSTQNMTETLKKANNSLGETFDSVEGLANNLNVISCGVRRTLNKKAGGLRLFFGKVLDECD